MAGTPARFGLSWTTLVPPLGALVLPFVWGRELPALLVAVLALLLGGSVLAAVHHAEVVAHRAGEPFGSLVLAVAVTIIEVGPVSYTHLDVYKRQPTWCWRPATGWSRRRA